MTAHRDFIENIARKLGRPTPTSVQPIEVKVPLFRLNSQEERIHNFLSAWQSLGGKGVTAGSTVEAAQALKDWFGEQPDWLSSQAIVTWNELPVMARGSLDQLGWQTRAFSDFPDRSARIDAIGKTALGITGADYGIAQSGTLVMKSTPKRGRAVSLVPPRHVSFVAGSLIRDALDQVLEELSRSGESPAAIDLISGPSRTSDIEMDLSIGVHGPIEVYVIVMTNP